MSMTSRTRTALRRQHVLVAWAASLLVLTACGGDADDSTADTGDDGNSAGSATEERADDATDEWADVVAAAEDEGALVLATHGGPGFVEFGEVAKEAMAEHFEVEVTTMRAGDWVSRVLSEQGAGQYLWDIHVGPANNKFNSLIANDANAVDPIKPMIDSLPDENRQDSDWGGGFDLYDTEEGTSFIYSVALLPTVFVNRDVVGDEVNEARDILDPKWSDQIIMYEPDSVNGTVRGIALLLSNPDYGPEFVEQLFEQDITFGTGSQVSQWLAEGRYGIAFGADTEELDEFREAGVGENTEVLEWAGSAGVYTASLLPNAPHENATKVFLNWFLSTEGQSAWAELADAESSSRRLDVPVKNPQSTPDYENIESYEPFMGTADMQPVIEDALAAINEARGR